MTEQSQIALYQGVNVEKAAYMAAFSQAGGLQSIIDQITQQAHDQAKGLDASTAANRKKLASIAYSVAQAKTGIDGEGKDLVSEAKAKIKVVDDNRKASPTTTRKSLGAASRQRNAQKARVTKPSATAWPYPLCAGLVSKSNRYMHMTQDLRNILTLAAMLLWLAFEKATGHRSRWPF